MRAFFSLILFGWAVASWFSAPYERAFLNSSLFKVSPLIPFIACLLWSLAMFGLWFGRCGREVWEKVKEYFHGHREVVLILGGILIFHLLVVSGPAILNYWGENDFDSALHGLAGYHIADGGERPMYVYGNHYVGMFKAHIAALFNLVLGKSPMYQRLIGAFFYLGFLVGLFIFARRLFNEKTALLAAALAALPPCAVAAQLRYDEFIELPFWGIIGFNLLLSLTHEKKNNWKYYFWYGVVLGVQFFAHPQAVYFIVIGIIVMFGVDKLFFLRWRHALIPLGFMMGSIPTWVDSYFHNGVIFKYFFAREIEHVDTLPVRLNTVLGHLARNFTEFWGIGTAYPLSFHVPKLLVAAVMMAALAGLIYYTYITREEIKAFFTSGYVPPRRMVPLIMIVLVSVIFCLSEKAVRAGPFRYVYVLWMVIPVVIAACAAVPKSKWGKGLGVGFLVVSTALFSLSQVRYFQVTREKGHDMRSWLNYCREKNITRFYGVFRLVYHSNFISKEEIIGSACYPVNNDPYWKYRKKVDHSTQPPAYVFSIDLQKRYNLRIKAARFKKILDTLGIRYTREEFRRHIVFYNLSEHLSPIQFISLPLENKIAYEGFSVRGIGVMTNGDGSGDIRLLTIRCRNLGKSVLQVDGKGRMAELVITAADGTLLRRQPLDKNVPPGELFTCRALLSLAELKGRPISVQVKLNDINISVDKRPLLLRPKDLEIVKPGLKDGDEFMDLAKLRAGASENQLPEYILVNGWGNRLRNSEQVVQWSGGTQSEIAFPLPDSHPGIVAELVLEPFKEDSCQFKTQSVHIYCNEIALKGEYMLHRCRTLRLFLPANLLHAGLNRLRIKPRWIEPECHYRRRLNRAGFNFRPRAFALLSFDILQPAPYPGYLVENLFHCLYHPLFTHFFERKIINLSIYDIHTKNIKTE